MGSADLIGIVMPLGKFLALEVKRPGEKPSEAQAHWLALVRKAGGIAGVVTSVEEAISLVESAQQWRGEVCAACGGTCAVELVSGESARCNACGTDGRVWRKAR